MEYDTYMRTLDFKASADITDTMKSIPLPSPSPPSSPSPTGGPARTTSNVVGIGCVIPWARAASALSLRRLLSGEGGSDGSRRRRGVPAERGDCVPGIRSGRGSDGIRECRYPLQDELSQPQNGVKLSQPHLIGAGD